MRVALLTLVFGVVPATSAYAHYHMLLPDRHSVKAGDKVVVTYQFGHPFEHELFDTEKPVKAFAVDPDHKSVDLLPSFEKAELPGGEGKKVAAFRFNFQPPGRGDYTLIVESPPIWMADEKHFVRDVCRLVIHVETQKGWDVGLIDAKPFTLLPLTRPYGLRPGTVFQTQVPEASGGLISYCAAEVERYNPTPPTALPPDEHRTLALKTDRTGVVTCSLLDPGWWSITVTRRLPRFEKAITKEHDGKEYPVIDRATLWVPVDEKIPLKPAE
jgi:uncharacterized GH25 family protein